ncbi:MAG: O-antigen ligase domain-containing protein [Sphingobacteriales bacterium]|nr:MAG: O-antigen ligase domain-containing protein [Sphingobacteriales bacterium]
MVYYHQPVSALWSPAYLSHNFSAPLDLHATYLSLFLALAFTFFTQRLLAGKHAARTNILLLLALMLLAAGLVQLASRAVLTGQLLVCFLLLPFSIAKGKHRAYFVGCLLLLCVAAGFLLHLLPHLYQRLITDLGADLGTTRGNGLIADPRAARWRLCLGLIGEAPLAGHGSGSEVVLLRAAYFRNGMYDSYLHSLNAHNQYLSLLIRHGLIGLACWVASLLLFARLAWRRRDGMLGAFLLLFACAGASENLLDVNKGIFFYAFFLALLSAGAKNTARVEWRSNPKGSGNVRIKQASKPAHT